MDRIRIRGGRPLSGEIKVGGAKNAALPLMVAGMLTDERLMLSNVPRLADIQTMTLLLAQHGIAVEPVTNDGRTLSLGGSDHQHRGALRHRPQNAGLVSGAGSAAGAGGRGTRLAARRLCHRRPADRPAPERAGADWVRVSAWKAAISMPASTGGCSGATIVFPFVSVGATENLLMAASLAEGRTVLANAAREPEIGDLAACLVAMGARIEGIGSDKLIIEGVDCTARRSARIIPDRIETGSYACAAAISGGSVFLRDARLDHLGATVRILREAGVEIIEQPDGLLVKRLNGLHGADVMTEPYPGFPTDMQAQFMALMSVAEGASMVTETIFENRFMHVPELNRMGARINVHGASAIVRGVPVLSGAPVMATDLRASLSLILAGLAAQGETMVNRVYHLDRGYEAVEQKLAACGADIERTR